MTQTNKKPKGNKKQKQNLQLQIYMLHSNEEQFEQPDEFMIYIYFDQSRENNGKTEMNDYF